MNRYQNLGYANRHEYLSELADEYCVPLSTVLMMADMLGPEEDFDGLVCFVADLQDEFE